MAGHVITADRNATMLQKNTKQFWTTLAIARYYENEGTAARLRDIYPYLSEVVGNPSILSATLSTLNKKDVLDRIYVQTSDGHGMYAYYPTPITIEELRDAGEPTELPDGSPIPADLNTEIPTSRVAAEDEVEAPRDATIPAPEYEPSTPTGSRRGERDWEWPEEPDAMIMVLDEEDDAESSDEGHHCEHCDTTFDSRFAYAGHLSGCGESTDDEPTQEDWLELGQTIDDMAGRAARSALPNVHNALRDLAELADEGELPPEIARAFLRGDARASLWESQDSATP
jgi:hypothetical protein